MGQIFFQDNIPSAVRASSTTVTLATTNMGQPTRITVGGQQYVPGSTLTLSTGSTGANGLDTGAIGSHLLWYVYAIVQQTSSTLALIASQTSSGPIMPSGYGTASALVGAFYSTDASTIGSMVTIEGEASSEWQLVSTPNISSNLTPSGVGARNRLMWRRQGDTMFLDWSFRHGSTGGASAGIVGIGLPGLFAMDTAKMSDPITDVTTRGSAIWFDKSASSITQLAPFATTSTVLRFIKQSSTANLSAVTDITASSDDELSMMVQVPITGWGKTLL